MDASHPARPFHGSHGGSVHPFVTPRRPRFRPTYTNLGVDDRNQFALTRSLPGGVEGLRAVVKQLQARGVRCLWAYNP